MTATDYGYAEVCNNLDNASREDLVSYLENEGFGVYASESTETLREAVELHLEMNS